MRDQARAGEHSAMTASKIDHVTFLPPIDRPATLAEQAGDDDFERGDRLGPVAPAVMLEDDRARPGVRHDVADDVADARPRPVAGVDGPVQRHEALARAVLQGRLRPGAVRCAEHGRGGALTQTIIPTARAKVVSTSNLPSGVTGSNIPFTSSITFIAYFRLNG